MIEPGEVRPGPFVGLRELDRRDQSAFCEAMWNEDDGEYWTFPRPKTLEPKPLPVAGALLFMLLTGLALWFLLGALVAIRVWT